MTKTEARADLVRTLAAHAVERAKPTFHDIVDLLRRMMDALARAMVRVVDWIRDVWEAIGAAFWRARYSIRVPMYVERAAHLRRPALAAPQRVLLLAERGEE